MWLLLIQTFALLTPSVAAPTSGVTLQQQLAKTAKNEHAPSSTSDDDGVWWHGSHGFRFSTRGLEWIDSEHDRRVGVGGRMHLDTVFFHDDITPFSNDLDYRRLRLYTAVRWRDFGARAERDIGGTVKGWKSVYLRYYGPLRTHVTFGNQIAPFSGEENTSSNEIPFLERSLANALSTGFLSGIAVSTRGKHWAGAVGYFNDPIDNQPKRRSKGNGLNARATWALLKTDDALVHIGGSLEFRDVDRGSRFRIRTRPESGLAGKRLIDTRTIFDVKDTTTYSAESILRYKRFTAQGEYIKTRVDRRSAGVTFKGWSARAGLLLRGSPRHYHTRSGTLGALGANDRFGAVELSARVSRLDLTNKDIFGGVGTDYTVGINWRLSPNLRILAETVIAKADPNRNALNEDLRLVQIRLQVNL